MDDISLMWVRCHLFISWGMQKADELPRYGSATKFTGLEPVIGTYPGRLILNLKSNENRYTKRGETDETIVAFYL